MDNIIKSVIFKRKYVYIKGEGWEYKIPKECVCSCYIESEIKPPIEEVTLAETKRIIKTKLVLEWGN